MPKVTPQLPPARAKNPPPVAPQKTARPKAIMGNGRPQENIWDRVGSIHYGDDEGIKALFYGKTGTGKTTLWATFPKKILAILCSGGDKPGELRSIDTPENMEVIKKVNLLHSEEIHDLCESFPARGKGFNTLVLDHLSGLEDRILAEILGMDKVPEQKFWGLADREQYAQCQRQCKELLRKILSLSCNVVIVAHERIHGENDDSGTGLIQPSIGAAVMPKFAPWLYGAMDYIGQTFYKEKETAKVTTIGKGKDAKKMTKYVGTGEYAYYLRTGPSTLYATKFRKPKGGDKIPEYIEDPDYLKIMKLVRWARQGK
jgi:hypothetical protein